MNRVRSAYGFGVMLFFIISLHSALAILSSGQQDDDKIIVDIINDIKKHPLDSHLWEKIVKHPSYRLLKDPNPQVFASLGLHAVLSQTQTLIRDSFLQHNLANVKEANVLWKSFFVMYDELKKRELGLDGYQSDAHKESQRLPLAVRALKVAKKFESEKSLSEGRNYSQEIDAAQKQQFSILSTGGTFGMNFNRRANAIEAGSLVKSLRALGENIAAPKVRLVNEVLHEFTIKLGAMSQSNVNQAVAEFIRNQNPGFKGVVTDENMLDSLYHYIMRPVLLDAAHKITDRLIKPLSSLNNDQQAALREHQINCAVVALYHVFGGHTVDIFGEIDAFLQRRLGSKKSEQRYNEIMAMVGYSIEEDSQDSVNKVGDLAGLDDDFLKLSAVG